MSSWFVLYQSSEKELRPECQDQGLDLWGYGLINWNWMINLSSYINNSVR